MRILVYAALCGWLSTATLVAQPAAVNIISGNGQLACELCITGANVHLFDFDPLVVQVVDANKNPVKNYAVTWTVTSGSVYLSQQGGGGGNTTTTYTDNSGTASTPIGQTPAQQSGPQFTLQSIIVANAGSATATFYETQASPDPVSGLIDVYPCYVPSVNPACTAPLGETLTGVAGSTVGPSFGVSVYTNTNAPVPNVSLFIVNADNSIGPSTASPSIYCQTQPGAGAYTALTNAQGSATCNVQFGPVPFTGTRTYQIVVGGSLPRTAGNAPDTNFITGPQTYSAVPPTVGAVVVISGSNQTALAGSPLQPLVAAVYDTSSHPLQSQVVTWAATPSNAIQLNDVTSISDSNGLVEVAAPVLSTLANGTITVTATSNRSQTAAPATFLITATQPVVPSSLTIESGNNQTAVENAAFTNLLAVLVTGSNGLPMSGVSVSFAGNGPVALSVTSTTTNSNGVAMANATAGLVPGTATVTASIGGLSQVFTLTVLAPGPGLTTASFVNGADGQVGSISPCSIAAIVGAGVAPGGAGMPSVVGPLQYEVATDTVSFGTGSSAIPAPIFSVSNIPGQQRILIQVPCELQPGSVQVTVTVNGGAQTLNVNVLPASPGIFQTTMSDGVVRAVIERPDGSFVSLSNPARRGETDMVYVTGLGSVSPQVYTNTLPILYTPSTINTNDITVGINNSGVPVTAAQLSSDMIGVYNVQFQVPSDAPQGNNVPFSVAFLPPSSTTRLYSGPSSIPIE
ncbi:MAG: hypothetical protein WBL61_23280 [Bryobacteraceae bacterium]